MPTFVFFVCFSGLIFGLDSFLNRLYATFLNVVTNLLAPKTRYRGSGLSIWFIRWFRVRLYEGLISYR
jgi:hypothetical protein